MLNLFLVLSPFYTLIFGQGPNFSTKHCFLILSPKGISLELWEKILFYDSILIISPLIISPSDYLPSDYLLFVPAGEQRISEHEQKSEVGVAEPGPRMWRKDAETRRAGRTDREN